jgi:hypothetical protein
MYWLAVSFLYPKKPPAQSFFSMES